MTYEEYDRKINEVLANPDTALANIAPIMAELKNDLTSLETAAQENENLNSRIRDLQETNMKLYLAQTGKSDVDETEGGDEPKEGQAAVDEFLSDVFKEKEE